MMSMADTEASMAETVIKHLPGSKYWANRYLILAALSDHPVLLSGVPKNEDIEKLCEGLRRLGHRIDRSEDGTLKVSGRAEFEKGAQQPVSIDCGESGTMARFMSAMVALYERPVTLTGSSRLCERPMQPLFAALRSLGVEVHAPDNRLPATICGPAAGGEVVMDASESSQFISALMLIAARLPKGLTICRSGTKVSSSYIAMTLRALEEAGVMARVDGETIHVSPGTIDLGDRQIPADASAASYYLMAGALGPKPFRLDNYVYRPTTHGEFRFVDHLARMGVQIELAKDAVRVWPCRKLLPARIHCSDCPDVVQSLAVMAIFADGTSEFTGLSALKHKESDRVADTATELKKLGVPVQYGDDWMTIEGGCPLRSANLHSHGDHRMAMALAQVAWRHPAIKISGAEAVRKSFPDYWMRMDELGLPKVCEMGGETL